MTDGAKQHFKNRFQIANLIHHKDDFGVEKQNGILAQLPMEKVGMTVSAQHLREKHIEPALLQNYRKPFYRLKLCSNGRRIISKISGFSALPKSNIIR